MGIKFDIFVNRKREMHASDFTYSLTICFLTLQGKLFFPVHDSSIDVKALKLFIFLKCKSGGSGVLMPLLGF